MKALLNKELRLALHPTVFFFLFMGLMLLIPSYPYYVPFFYVCLSVFFCFLSGRENKDILFSALLPVRKRDTVRARCITVAVIELASVVASIPFACISIRHNPNGSNLAGIECNVAFYGLVLIMLALFNYTFITRFYRTAYKVGSSFGIGCVVVGVYVILAEIAVHIPSLAAYLDRSDAATQIRQLPLLGAGIIIYALSMVLACRNAQRLFEVVDL
ncbi:MAG: ABC-2 transporter permease [Clostridia bacterium]|nr:ABC-2 transporter permease [Clostridia bacterium]